MNSHELARLLLSLPDLPVVGEEDGELGYCSTINSVDIVYYDGNHVYNEPGVDCNESHVRIQAIQIHHNPYKEDSRYRRDSYPISIA